MAGNRLRDIAELGAAGAERRGHDLEGPAVRAFRHLGRVFLPQPAQPDRVFAQRIADRGAQNVGTLRLVSGCEVAPALA